MIKVENSTAVAGYFYNDKTKILLVEYKNKSVYLYEDISSSTVKKIFTSDSVGKMLRKHIIEKEPTPLRIK